MWLQDDGFGREVVKRLEQRELPEGVAVFDFGTGGLDLAYEVMRGYDALILVDVSRQGGEPGTLYVMEPDQEEINSGFEDGEMIDPHGMDPQTVLRFVNAVGGWPGKVVVVACEPLIVEEMGMGLTDEVEGAVDRAVDVVLEQVEELRVHELSLSSAILDTVLRHADERKVNPVDLTVGALRQVVPTSLEFYWGIVTRDTVCEGARLDLDAGRGAAGLRRLRRSRSGRSTSPIFRCPAAAART